MSVKILVINPGSTSTKIAVYNNYELLFNKNISHSKEELLSFKDIIHQFDFRKKIILNSLIEWGIELDELRVIMGRGGLVKPIESGIYEVNDSLEHDLKIGVNGKHASNLGGLLARSIAVECKRAKAYIADPVVVDELCELARISGCKELPRKSIFHALNQKAVARDYAKKINCKYEDLNLIVVHMGGGVSVGAHVNGRVIDVNNALSGDGPFSPERSGSLVAVDLLDLAFSGNYTYSQLYSMIVGKGGFISHLESSDIKSIVDKVLSGENKEKLIVEAFAYNIAKSIGAMAAVLKGKIDAIILTGGIAYSDYICNLISERIKFISKIEIFAGEDEMEALALNGLMLYEGQIEVKKY